MEYHKITTQVTLTRTQIQIYFVVEIAAGRKGPLNILLKIWYFHRSKDSATAFTPHWHLAYEFLSYTHRAYFSLNFNS